MTKQAFMKKKGLTEAQINGELIQGNLDLGSLTSLPEGVSLSAGGYLYLGSLTSLPEGVEKPFLTPYITPDGKIIADRICQKLISKKGNIYKVRSFGQFKDSYLVVDGDKCSHGVTIKEAKESLIYKLSTRDTYEFKGMTMNTVLPFSKAIQAYRAITGSCEAGTRGFIESLDKVKKEYKVSEILELTDGKYGFESFKAFVNGGKS